jgi:branched-chain amino acid transport system ATP-binding protein
MLHIKNLTAGYGKVNVLHGISLDVNERECVALIGANGAGKSTTLRCICGLNEVRSGSIEFLGERLDGMSGHAIVRKGITMCPEGRQVFAEMSVVENLEMGAQTEKGQADWAKNLDQMYSLFPILSTRKNQLAGTLSGGEQQMVAIARGMMSSPKLIMLDEPSMGLAPKITDMIFERIEEIHANTDVAILLVEQRVAEALSSCDHGYVLQTGRIALEGVPSVLMEDPHVKEIYLGM